MLGGLSFIESGGLSAPADSAPASTRFHRVALCAHNGAIMRHPFVYLSVLAVLLTLCGASTAQVIRCVDAKGNVSYGDTACAKGSKQAELVLDRDATDRRAEPDGYRRQEQLEGVDRASRLQRDTVDAVTRNSQAPGGVVILDSRPNERIDDQRERDRQRREADLAADEAWRLQQDPSYRGPAARPRDMRPRISNCNAAGCSDNQGNTYDRAGKLDRYVTPDGKNCRPVGTTVVCN